MLSLLAERYERVAPLLRWDKPGKDNPNKWWHREGELEAHSFIVRTLRRHSVPLSALLVS
jgi:hypothetical protein